MALHLQVEVTETGWSTVQNTSTVRIKVTASTSKAGIVDVTSKGNLTITLDGETVVKKETVRLTQNDKVVFTKTYTVPHNSDGSKTVTWNVRLIDWDYYDEREKHGSLTLHRLPGVSVISLDSSSATLGDVLTIQTNRKSTAYTHRLQYSFVDDDSSFVTFANDVEGVYKWSLPYTLANNVAFNSTTANLYIRCITYNGSTRLGYSQTNITIVVPYSDETKPNISSITASEGTASSPFTVFVQNYSRLKIHIEASGKYNAVITSCATTVQGVTYTHSVNNGVISDIGTNVITQSGDITITTVVIDSRNFVYEKNVTVNIVPYSTPVISALNVVQSNNSLDVKINGGVSELGGQNRVTLKINYKKVSDINYQTSVVYNGTTNYTFTNVPSSPISYSGLLADTPCVVQVVLNDLICDTEALAVTKEFITNVNFVIGKSLSEFIGIPTNGDLYTCSYIPVNGTNLSSDAFRQRSWQLQDDVTVPTKIKEICYDEIINKFVGYTSNNKIVVGDTTSDWEEVSMDESFVGIYQVFNKAIILGSTHIYWIDNDYLYGEASLSDCIQSKDLPITTSPWIYIFGNTLCLFIMNIQGDVYHLEYADENWRREPVDYYLDLSATNNPYKPLQDYAPIANAKFFNGGGWIYMIYEGTDGWKMLTAPIHAYR